MTPLQPLSQTLPTLEEDVLKNLLTPKEFKRILLECTGVDSEKQLIKWLRENGIIVDDGTKTTSDAWLTIYSQYGSFLFVSYGENHTRARTLIENKSKDRDLPPFISVVTLPAEGESPFPVLICNPLRGIKYEMEDPDRVIGLSRADVMNHINLRRVRSGKTPLTKDKVDGYFKSEDPSLVDTYDNSQGPRLKSIFRKSF